MLPLITKCHCLIQIIKMYSLNYNWIILFHRWTFVSTKNEILIIPIKITLIALSFLPRKFCERFYFEWLRAFPAAGTVKRIQYDLHSLALPFSPINGGSDRQPSRALNSSSPIKRKVNTFSDSSTLFWLTGCERLLATSSHFRRTLEIHDRKFIAK